MSDDERHGSSSFYQTRQESPAAQEGQSTRQRQDLLTEGYSTPNASPPPTQETTSEPSSITSEPLPIQPVSLQPPSSSAIYGKAELERLLESKIALVKTLAGCHKTLFCPIVLQVSL